MITNQQNVDNLVMMGFTQGQAELALAQANGRFEEAISLLVGD